MNAGPKKPALLFIIRDVCVRHWYLYSNVAFNITRRKLFYDRIDMYELQSICKWICVSCHIIKNVSSFCIDPFIHFERTHHIAQTNSIGWQFRSREKYNYNVYFRICFGDNWHNTGGIRANHALPVRISTHRKSIDFLGRNPKPEPSVHHWSSCGLWMDDGFILDGRILLSP